MSQIGPVQQAHMIEPQCTMAQERTVWAYRHKMDAESSSRASDRQPNTASRTQSAEHSQPNTANRWAPLRPASSILDGNQPWCSSVSAAGCQRANARRQFCPPVYLRVAAQAPHQRLTSKSGKSCGATEPISILLIDISCKQENGEQQCTDSKLCRRKGSFLGTSPKRSTATGAL